MFDPNGSWASIHKLGHVMKRKAPVGAYAFDPGAYTISVFLSLSTTVPPFPIVRACFLPIRSLGDASLTSPSVPSNLSDMITVAAGLIESNGQILIARRRNVGRHGRKWEFPGGKVEPNESPEECVRRELQEELGITAKVGELFCVSEYDYPDFSIRLEVYCIRSISGYPVALEHDEIRWIEPKQIEDFDFPEADRPVVAKIVANRSALLSCGLG